MPMLPTYRAILDGDHIEWEDEVPEAVRDQSRVAVLVTIVDESTRSDKLRGERMAEALERIAVQGGLPAIDDVSGWER